MLSETQKNRKDAKVNYVCREALEFIAMREEKSFSTRLEHDDIEQEDGLISFQQEDFVDDYMRIMEQRVARQNLGLAEEFMAGDREDVIQLTNNKRNDLQDYLIKILRKEKFYYIKADMSNEKN